jgi:hypothetical protein
MILILIVLIKEHQETFKLKTHQTDLKESIKSIHNNTLMSRNIKSKNI